MIESTSSNRASGIRLLGAMKVAFALVVPWAIIGTILRSHPDLGFYLGFTAGAFCVWMLRPSGIKTWRIVIFYLAVVLLRLALGPSFIH